MLSSGGRGLRSGKGRGAKGRWVRVMPFFRGSCDFCMCVGVESVVVSVARLYNYGRDGMLKGVTIGLLWVLGNDYCCHYIR